MTRTDVQTVRRLIDVLATCDRPGLDEILDGGVRLQALLPRRYVELTGSADVAGEMLGWFDDEPEIVPIETRAEAVGDLWHAGYRFAVRGKAQEEVVEQHAYCTVADGLITAIRLICSGFRPAHDEAAVASAARRIDALGDGCATLTPRIAATLREMAPGQVLAVLTDDASAPDDIAAWSRLTGHEIVAITADVAGNRYYLRHA